MTTTRGERNNNPGNIRHGDSWQGMATEQPDASFITFTDAKYGIRAIAKILLNYSAKYNLRTVATIINRWAPPSENDTVSYIRAVAAAIGVPPTQVIDVTDASVMRHLVLAIINHENGRISYGNDKVREGLALAGIS